MDTLTINVLNPKAKKLLQGLADLNLISIESQSRNEFNEVVDKLRLKSANTISLDEITNEVESVRTMRHGKKA